MVTQLIGALVRAILVALLIALPSLLLPGVDDGAREVAMVFAMIGALITLVEYGASHPGLVEFRFAPPFNRLRFLSIFITVLALAIMCRGDLGATEMTRTINDIGLRVGVAMDFSGSPVRIVTSLMAENASPAHKSLVQSAAGVSYLVSLVMLAVFVVSLRILHWPLAHGAFNLWINLPTYDWSRASDAEVRLRRDARVNIIFGFTLPFLIPMIGASFDGFYDLEALQNHQTLIWMMAIWAFLPASLFMRGIAMSKIARLIHRKRQLLHDPGIGGFAPA